MIRIWSVVISVVRLLVVIGSIVAGSAAHAQGGAEGKAPKKTVNLLVFSDYSCPYCGQAWTTLEQLKAKYGERIAIIYKHFPLRRTDEGFLPHEAALASASQGRFWEMHSALFKAMPNGITPDKLLVVARTAGLDVREFQQDIQSGKWRARIREDIAEGEALKVVATPTIYVAGYKLEGAQSQETLERMIEYGLSGK